MPSLPDYLYSFKSGRRMEYFGGHGVADLSATRSRVHSGLRRQMLAAQRQACRACQLEIAADVRTPIIVPAPPRCGVVPEALLLRLLTAIQAGKVRVDFAGQLFGQAGRTKGMTGIPFGARDIQQHRRTDPLATQPATIAVFRFQYVELQRDRYLQSITPQ